MREQHIKLGKSLEEAEQFILEKQLFGFDIDRMAVALCKINLILQLESAYSNKYLTNILQKNILIETPYPNTYDIIIGNPPWGYHYTKEDIHFFKTNY